MEATVRRVKIGLKEASRSRAGFTLIELLVVIVIIAILASISVVAYTGIQQRARDAQRAHDGSVITQALEMYYFDNGEYPTITGGSTTINSSWATTNDASWSILESALVPEYLSTLPVDPAKDTGNPQSNGVYGYGYFGNKGSYCGRGYGQVYILVYTYESKNQKNDLIGDCSSSGLGPYHYASNYRVSQ